MTAIVNRVKFYSVAVEVAVLVGLTVALLATAVVQLTIVFGS